MDTLKTIKINNKEYNMSSPTSDGYKKLMIESFGDVVNSENVKESLEVIIYNVDGFYIELKSNTDKKYKVDILDGDKIIYTSNLSSGMYSKLNRTYYTKWRVKIYDGDTLITDYNLDLSGSRIFIVFESSSLGDTLAWMPYCEEFRKKHNCHVIVSSFMNSMFQDQYPEIEFVDRGVSVQNIK
jgi:autotransporter strand-loop-strand O-heptosyltransferase